jgi:Putative Flp pilus-assembly TadE/G-like
VRGAFRAAGSSALARQVANNGRPTAFQDERGSILVMSAVMIPVFLLLTALVVDVGNWYTHKRQLQNRADAGAFAAGIEYAKNWKACVQSSDPVLRATTGVEIADAAREYAGDPEATDYNGATLPVTLRNTEIANQANLDVVINSNDPNYTDDTDYTDGSPSQAHPCYLHTTGDDISAPGHWTDVRVKERDLPSLVGAVGLPLARNGARARVEVRPAISGTRFLPLAVPNNIITQVQVRYYNHCTSPATLLATRDLAPLPATHQGGFAAAGGGTLWGLPSAADPNVGDPNQAFSLTLPTYGGCSQPYLPVGVEVRLASRNEIDLNSNTCAQLLAMQYADCFTRLSQIRVWNDGNAASQVRIRDVNLTGGCGTTDAYFGALPVAATNCRFGANVDVFWGTRAQDELAVSSNFSVKVNGVAANPPGATTPSGVWTVPSNVLTASTGANTVTVEVDWTDTNTSHTWEEGGGQCRSGTANPCKYDGPVEPVHQTFVGTPGTAGAVALVRTSSSPWNGMANLPGDPYANVADGGNTITVFPTVGIRGVLKTGVYTTLRLDDPQSNQTLQCDPNLAQGQEFTTFRYGCEPWYGANTFTPTPNANTTGSWWNTSTKTCPPDGQWFSYNDQGAGFGVNSSSNPWRCVLTAPGMSTGQVGDYMAAATDNCDNYNNNSCQTFDCNNDGNYDGKTGSSSSWIQQGGDSRYPRVIKLFIVPYQASKGLTGQGDELPVLGFASFYVMNWTGSNTNQSDRCPDRTFDHDQNPLTPQITLANPPAGAIAGVFVETVDYEAGPVDPTAVCVEGQLTPCRVALVR